MVTLFLPFWEFPDVFQSRCIILQLHQQWRFQFFHILIHIVIMCLFHYSHHSGYEVSNLLFNSVFSDGEDLFMWLLSLYLLWKKKKTQKLFRSFDYLLIGLFVVLSLRCKLLKSVLDFMCAAELGGRAELPSVI